MSRMRCGRGLKPVFLIASALALIMVVLLGCGPQPAGLSAPAPEVSAGTTNAGANALPITRDEPGGLVAGLVFAQPVLLEEALSIGSELGGDLIALYRTDYAFVQPVTGGYAEWQPEPSRFTYVDPGKIEGRRRAAAGAGLSPPITGGNSFQSYYDHCEDQWAQAQEPGVRFEAVALYLQESALGAVRADARFRAVVPIPYGRSESLSPDYMGELFLDSEAFPPGFLTEPQAQSPSSSLNEEEIAALVAELKAESPDVTWADLTSRRDGAV